MLNKGDRMSELLIRWADYQDWFQLGLVSSESYRETYAGIIPDTYLDAFSLEKRQIHYKRALLEDAKTIVILLVNSKAAGYLEFGNSKDTDLDNTYGEIYNIYTLKSYWGKGYGKKLITWGIDRLQEAGYSNVSLWVLKENINAKGFYEHLGFINDELERTIIRGKELIQLRYSKKLEENNLLKENRIGGSENKN
jgi:ribosomal protein S18 acetylase RimI-like enzyme